MDQKIVLNLQDLSRFAKAHKELGHKIICTIGSWDMLHIGHVRYLNEAKEHGDVLIVGVDSDRGIKLYKNPLRPIIPETERMEMLSYQHSVDFVTLVDDVDEEGKWQYSLIKEVPIDAFVTVEGDSYTDEQRETIEELCGKIITLPRQAETTSTTNIVQNIVKKHLLEAVNKLKI